MNIFRTFWKSVRELFDELLIVFVANLLWLLINLPLFLVLFVAFTSGSSIFFFVALVLGALSFGPANAGLYTIAERITEGRTSSWRDFVAGMRSYARLSWKVYGLWLLGLAMILFNLQFYNLNGSQISAFIGVIFLYLLVAWLGLLIYIGPLMMLQTEKSLRAISHNAALMTFGRPVFTLGTLVLMGVILFTSVWLTLLLITVTFGFLALWGFRATLTLIAEAAARREKAAEQAGGPTAKGRGGQVRPRD